MVNGIRYWNIVSLANPSNKEDYFIFQNLLYSIVIHMNSLNLFVSLAFILQVGVVSDEKLLELLELALSSNTAETVKRARELMDSGVEPMVLMSQLASLIMDVIAGTYNIVDSKYSHSFFGGRACEFII